MEMLKLFLREARNKMTTWVGLSIATVAELAAHSEELLAQWPSLAAYLPQTETLQAGSKHVLAILGVLVVYTRVRRLLATPRPE